MEDANTTDYMISEVSLNPTTKNSTLTIVSIQTSDMGTYTCNAANLVSSESSSTMLIIDSKWSVNFMYIHTSINDTASTCVVVYLNSVSHANSGSTGNASPLL